VADKKKLTRLSGKTDKKNGFLSKMQPLFSFWQLAQELLRDDCLTLIAAHWANRKVGILLKKEFIYN